MANQTLTSQALPLGISPIELFNAHYSDILAALAEKFPRCAHKRLSILRQLCYWISKGSNKAFIYKTDAELAEELASKVECEQTGEVITIRTISKQDVTRTRRAFVEMGLFRTRVKKHNGNPTIEYHELDIIRILSILKKVIHSPVSVATKRNVASDKSITELLQQNKNSTVLSESMPSFDQLNINQASQTNCTTFSNQFDSNNNSAHQSVDMHPQTSGGAQRYNEGPIQRTLDKILSKAETMRRAKRERKEAKAADKARYEAQHKQDSQHTSGSSGLPQTTRANAQVLTRPAAQAESAGRAAPTSLSISELSLTQVMIDEAKRAGIVPRHIQACFENWKHKTSGNITKALPMRTWAGMWAKWCLNEKNYKDGWTDENPHGRKPISSAREDATMNKYSAAWAPASEVLAPCKPQGNELLRELRQDLQHYQRLYDMSSDQFAQNGVARIKKEIEKLTDKTNNNGN